MNNSLLFGKSDLAKIVAIEPGDENAEIFIQQPDGSVKSQFVQNRYWLLSHKRPHLSWRKMDGDLHYKYGKQYSTREDFLKARNRLRNEDTFSIYNPIESLQVLRGYTYFKDLHPKDVTILSFDLETTSLSPTDENAKILLIANTVRKNGKTFQRLFAYDDYASEADMLTAWCDFVREEDPSILTGYNINLFDLRYIYFRAQELEVPIVLGRNDSSLKLENYESKFRKDGSQDYHYNKFKIYGREIVDGLFLTIRYDLGRKFSNYKLKTVIKEAGLEKPNRTFYPADQIRVNYKNPVEWEKIKEYCRDDGDDALSVFDLTVPAQFYSAQMIPKPFQLITESAAGSQINSIMIRAYIQDGHSLPKESEPEKFEGAISWGSPGIYDNCWSIDVASLYPSIMIEYKVYDSEKDPRAYFLELVETLTTERLANKKKANESGERYYQDLEQAQKVIINSCYGFMGSQGLIFNSPKNAAFVTSKGREILNFAIKWATGKKYEEWNLQNSK